MRDLRLKEQRNVPRRFEPINGSTAREIDESPARELCNATKERVEPIVEVTD
jgi:hypothetical protein